MFAKYLNVMMEIARKSMGHVISVRCTASYAKTGRGEKETRGVISENVRKGVFTTEADCNGSGGGAA